jgi:hypothetical protein
VEPDGEKGEPGKWSRSKQGTPQDGVISPLLANLYLHWFDKLFHRANRPAEWANAKLVGCADDYVVLDQYSRDRRYLHVGPSKKSVQRDRDRINEMTDRRQGYTPLPRLIGRLNRQLRGWANYFSLGYPPEAYRDINWHLGYRLTNHLRHNRSQRPYQLPEGVSYCEHFLRAGVPEHQTRESSLTRVFRRAGCGKSARPVRRGDSRPLSSRLMSYSTVYSVSCVGQNNSAGNVRRYRRPDLVQSYLRLGLKFNPIRHFCLIPPLGIFGPFLRQVQTIAGRQTGTPRSCRQTHCHPAVVLLTDLSAVLTRDAD